MVAPKKQKAHSKVPSQFWSTKKCRRRSTNKSRRRSIKQVPRKNTQTQSGNPVLFLGSTEVASSANQSTQGWLFLIHQQASVGLKFDTRSISGRSWPRDPSKRDGPEKLFRTHPESAPKADFKAIRDHFMFVGKGGRAVPQSKSFIFYALNKFQAELGPKWFPRPLQTGRARKRMQNAPCHQCQTNKNHEQLNRKEPHP